ADVWVNGRHVLHSENMFTSHEVELAALDEENELVIRFGALVARLAERRPRPRWKSYLVGHQNLRWLRTTLLGRLPGWAATPAPVGPWRSLELRRSSALRALGRHVVASCDGDDGVVTVRLRLRGSASPESAVLSVAGHRVPLDVTRRGPDLVVEGELRLSGVERWWPATHGRQPLYSVSVEIGEEKFSLGRVGFRTVELGGDLGAFEVRINGVPIFCRGAIWMPVDPVSMAPSEAAVRDALELMVTANMNMVRLPATGVYQDEVFWDTCDELGLLVWQDCMFAFVDPPNDPEFLAGVGEELEAVLTGLAGRPSLAVLCGGQEVAEQAAMLGTTRDKWTFPLLEEVIPEIARRLLPGTPYVTDNPFGGGLPFQMDAGVSHFFGVGGYLRPVEDARRAGVRFATECLAFAVAPEPETVDEVFGGPSRALDDPRWRKAVHHDAGRSWDMEDMQAHYLGRLFGVDPFVTRWQDAERYLELGRATVASLMTSVLTEWRRPGSPCTGGLILALRDLRPGPGWGLVDALGRPKAPWFALRRLFAPTALLMTDEGLNGLRLHLVNDTVQPLLGTVAVSLYARGELCVERGECPVELPARGGLEVDVADLFDGFRDLTAAYGFGRPAYDVVVAELFDAAGSSLSEVDYLPLGGIRPLEYDIGLEATARRDAGGAWSLEVATRRFAQWVAVDIPGFRAGDSWFHLPPGRTRTVTLRREPSRQPPVDAGPEGHVRALNCAEPTRIAVEHGP
ncbi:MAG TPA: glycoside hydrolase family 2 protein, partial [Acidimicrobiales bacterium]|nr:glycoside hydrolase family 2 protein [Acidimicrobiales bacterium]